MRNLTKILSFGLILAFLLSSCANTTGGTTRRVNKKDVLYLNLTWHQHQPLYYKDAAGADTTHFKQFA